MNNKKVLTKNEMHEIKIVYTRPLYDSMPKINHSKDAEKIMRDFADNERLDYKEFFWVLLLNRSNKVLGISEIGKGDIGSVTVNYTEIIQLALLTNATAIILCHNHPSGKITASLRDIEVTEKIKKILTVFSITLYDHIILTSENYYSLSDECLIK